MLKRNPDHYLSELLFDHNCVVIPQLGGFVTNYQPAKADMVLNRFVPPSKSISFNRHLVQNDGLLVSHMAGVETISYDEALSEVQNWVGLTLHQLRSGGTVTLTQVGALYTDDSGTLRFEPNTTVNYNRASFGLQPFYMPRIVRETVVPDEVTHQPPVTVVTQPTTAPVAQARIVPIERTSTWRTVARYAAIALAAPAIGYAIWFSAHLRAFRSTPFNYANLNPFTEKVCNAYQVRTHELEPVTPEPYTADFEMDSDQVFATLRLWDDKKPLTVKVTENLAEPVTTKVATELPPPNAAFNIIGGCFSIYTNAENLVSKLRAMGFQAYILDRKNGLFRVSYGGYTNRADAENALASARQRHNQNAWILSR